MQAVAERLTPEPRTIRDLAAAIYGDAEPSAAAIEATRRACARLVQQGRAEARWEVLRRDPSAPKRTGERSVRTPRSAEQKARDAEQVRRNRIAAGLSPERLNLAAPQEGTP